MNAVGMKPICSGGRGDALALMAASDSVLTVDDVNPWHFRAAVAPLLAARIERKCIKPHQVLDHIRLAVQRFEVAVIEGAGGLLSPLGEGFNTRDLIVRLKAVPIVVCPNRLGAVNQVLLVLSALPRGRLERAHVILMNQEHDDGTAKSNPVLLSEFLEASRVQCLPWVKTKADELVVEKCLASMCQRAGILRR